MFTRVLALLLIVVMLLAASAGGILAQEGEQAPEEGEGQAPPEDRPPTEYLAYLAVALFVLLLAILGFGWIRTQIRAQES